MGLLSKFLAKQRYSMIEPYIKGDILELGCQKAQILQEYKSKISSYSGVEISKNLVEGLKEAFPDASFFARDLDRDMLEINREFDIVLMVALIEHLFNQKFVMEEVCKVLKPGGIVAITTPTPFGNDVIHRAGASLGLFAKSAVDDHIVIYNRKRFEILAKEVGLHLKYHNYFQGFCNQLAILEKKV